MPKLCWLVFVALILVFSEAAQADCLDDLCKSVQRIYLARTSNFSGLVGKSLGRDAGGNRWWQGKERPLGLDCRVNAGDKAGNGYSYSCGFVEPLSQSEAAANENYEALIAAFKTVVPEFVWFDVDSFQGPQLEGGIAKNQLYVWIAMVRGGEDSFVGFNVDARPH